MKVYVMSNVIFLSIPSKGIWTFDGATKRWNVAESLLKVVADLHVQHPKCVFIAPSIQNYDVLPFLPEGFGQTYETWKERCRALLLRCDEVWVLKFPEWETSVGVADEIQFARGAGLRVAHLDFTS